MSTVDLINRIKRTAVGMSKEQKRSRLIKAHIIKDNGEYDPKFFSAETVQISKKVVASSRV